MTDFTAIPASTFDTDEPILGATHLAMYQNLFAFAEQSPGAPRAAARTVFSHLRSFNMTNTWEATDKLDGYNLIIGSFYARPAAIPNIFLQINAEDGAGIGTWQNFANVGTANGLFSIQFRWDKISGVLQYWQHNAARVDMQSITLDKSGPGVTKLLFRQSFAVSFPSGISPSLNAIAYAAESGDFA